MTEQMSAGWIGVDLDGTLAHYEDFKGVEHIGDPIPAMVERVKGWLAEGQEVRIFTARVYEGQGEQWRDVKKARSVIEAWCEKHFGQRLPITNGKDFDMIALWDDRAIQVIRNTGRSIADFVGKGCPCTLIKPCMITCSCANLVQSGGCLRCCSYGSDDQRKEQAEHLAKKVLHD